jgi:hypothetical protein
LLPAAFDRIAARLLAKPAGERYQTAFDLRKALAEIGGRAPFWSRPFPA